LKIASLLAVNEGEVLSGIAGYDEDTPLETICGPVPADLEIMSVSEARGEKDVIARIAQHTELSIDEVEWNLRKEVNHGRTLLPKVFSFIWLDRPEARASEPAPSKRRKSQGQPPGSVQVDPLPSSKASVFISYSRVDRKYLDALKIHLRPLERDSTFEIWEDSKIKPGSNWRDDISSAIERASAAVLFISANFLASDFIHSNEIPPLLAQAQSRGVRVLPLLVSYSLFLDHPVLSKFNAFNDPKAPLSTLGKNQRDLLYIKVAKELEALLSVRR
jgi:hypothetical protein